MHNRLARYCALIGTVFGLMSIAPPACGQDPVGIFDQHEDIGAVGSRGSASYSETTGEYTISSSGTNMWFDEDQFHFVWKRMSGDFILHAAGSFLGDGIDPHRKFGWMIRSNLSDSSRYVDVAVHGDGLISMQFRRFDGADTEQVQSRVRDADVVQLSRRGNTFTASVARSGDVLTSDHIADLDLVDSVYVGLFVCAHNNDVVETAVFHNVSISVPAAADFVPYQDYIGTRLETVEVETGRREVLMRSPHPIQAPNWTPDGRTLIYNDRGLLYRFDLATRGIEVLDTGFADQNNNDHVISFDGAQIAISHHSSDDDGESIVYRLPVAGGEPSRVTDLGPSYLHGWSPDGRLLTYTARRDGTYNIFAIPAEGGEEIQLTDTPGLDDGPEYAPDGRHIYFNSTRSGRMKLWRMEPDGSDPRQLTFDELSDWFPHVSPDGEWIVFLSYESDVEPAEHPFYKQVYLRLLPVDRPEGVRPRVIAYVYGGQGTMNVPSWSPDGKRVAFVSNDDLTMEHGTWRLEK